MGSILTPINVYGIFFWKHNIKKNISVLRETLFSFVQIQSDWRNQEGKTWTIKNKKSYYKLTCLGVSFDPNNHMGVKQ